MSSQLQRELSEYVGTRYTSEIARAWSANKIILELKTHKKQLRAVCTFFRWVAAKSPRYGAAANVVRIAKQTGSLPAREVVQACLSEFCSSLENPNDKTILQSRNVRSRINLAHELSSATKRLAAHGAFPRDLRVRIRLTKDPRARVKSLGELYQTQFGKKNSESLSKLNAKILAAIRICAEKDLLEQDDLAIIRNRVISGATSKSLLPLAKAVSRLKSSNKNSRRFPCDLEIAESFLADRFKSSNFSRDYSRQGQSIQALAKHFGKTNLDRWLGPTSVDFSAAFLMALCDTSWNVGPLYNLKHCDVAKDSKSGKITLSSVKKRSRGKRVRANLPVEPELAELWRKRKGATIAPASNIERWVSIINQFCELTRAPGPHLGAHFWALPIRPGLSLSRPREAAVHNWIKDFRVRHKNNPIFGGLKFTARNIRPSVLQAMNGGEPHQQLRTQMMAGHKGTGTTFKYLSSDEFLSDLKKYIRHYQDLLQAAMSRGIKNASIIFELPQGRLDFLNNLARQRGPSLFRSASELPKKPARPSDKTKMSLKLFAASRTSLEALYLTHKSAQLSLEHGPVDERWARVWLPFYALLEVLIERIRKSPYSRAYREISERAEENLRLGNVALPTVY